MKLLTAINDIWDAFIDWLETIGEDVMDFVKPLAKEIAKNGGKLLVTAAFEAVKAAETQGGNGKEKFQVAHDIVVEALKSQGLPIVVNAINGAIEGAVAKMKEEDAGKNS